MESGTSKSTIEIAARVKARAKNIEDAENSIIEGTAIGDEISLATPIPPAMLEARGGSNKLARALMEQVYLALGDDLKLAEPHFDPGMPLPDILRRLNRTVDLTTYGYQAENGAAVYMKPNANEWQHIYLYDRLPKAEVITGKNGDQWVLARSTHIIRENPLNNSIQYGLNYIRLPRPQQAK
jgi:hypothetical protein